MESGADLGGVWKFRQLADEISLDDIEDDDEDDDDDASLTTSDMADFDPFHPTEGTDSDNQDGDIWLLSAMSQLQTNGEMPSRPSTASLRQLEAELPLPPALKEAESSGSSDTMTGQSQTDGGQVTSSSQSPAGSATRQTSAAHSDDRSTERSQHNQLVDEFDPLKGGKVQCGKGDIDFNLTEPPSPQVQCGKGDLDFSLMGPSSPPPIVPFISENSSVETNVAAQSFQLQPPSQKGSSLSPKGSPRGSGASSPSRSPRKMLAKLNLKDKGAAYIVQAAKEISLAQQCEANNNYTMAFSYYKTGVGLLITGVQGKTHPQQNNIS